MTATATRRLIGDYYDAFNALDAARMVSLVSADIEHRVNEGATRHGSDAFADFCSHMGRSYRENLTDITIFASDDGTRAAAEFTVNGTYLETDPGLPEARGQSYRLPGGSFFEVRDDRISRVSTFYNLADWVAQVSA